jgi:hypothetical protein
MGPNTPLLQSRQCSLLHSPDNLNCTRHFHTLGAAKFEKVAAHRAPAAPQVGYFTQTNPISCGKRVAFANFGAEIVTRSLRSHAENAPGTFAMDTFGTHSHPNWPR